LGIQLRMRHMTYMYMVMSCHVMSLQLEASYGAIAAGSWKLEARSEFMYSRK